MELPINDGECCRPEESELSFSPQLELITDRALAKREIDPDPESEKCWPRGIVLDTGQASQAVKESYRRCNAVVKSIQSSNPGKSV